MVSTFVFFWDFGIPRDSMGLILFSYSWDGLKSPTCRIESRGIPKSEKKSGNHQTSPDLN